VEFKRIATVKNKFKKSTDFKRIREAESIILVKKEYQDGLYKIENNNYLKVIFNFHLSNTYNLKGKRRHGKERGVFASRSPNRPNSIGVTCVKLIERQGRKLLVTGLDALDQTPVLDIKPYSELMDSCKKITPNNS